MSYITPPIPPHQGGRPRGSGKIKKPEEKSTHPAKLSPQLMEIIQTERRHNESYSDTILRLLKSKTHDIEHARKKVDALERRLHTLAALEHIPEILIN